MSRVIDVFNHFLPPAFLERIEQLGGNAHMMKRAAKMPAMVDVEYRLRLMDRYEGYCQIPCVVSPNVEKLVPKDRAAELARFANEEFRKLCDRYPDRFPSFVAVLPLEDYAQAFERVSAAKDFKILFDLQK